MCPLYHFAVGVNDTGYLCTVVIQQHSKPDVIVAKNGDNLVLHRRHPQFIVTTMNIGKIELPKNTGKVALERILAKVARFDFHFLRERPGNFGSMITLELCQVAQGSDARYHRCDEAPIPGASVMDKELNPPFDPKLYTGPPPQLSSNKRLVSLFILLRPF